MSDFEIDRGEHRIIISTVTGLPPSGLTGYTILFSVTDDPQKTPWLAKSNPGSGAADIEIKTVGSDTVPGVIWTHIRKADTNGRPAWTESHIWDISLMDGSGEPAVIDSGKLTIHQHATVFA